MKKKFRKTSIQNLNRIQHLGFLIYKFLKKNDIIEIKLVKQIFIFFYFLYKKKFEATPFKNIETFIPINGVVIDVGAGLGFYSKLILKRLKKDGLLVALEPEENNFKTLISEISRTKTEAKSQVLQVAAWSYNTVLNLLLDTSNPANHQITTMESKYRVNGVTLDSLASNFHRLDFIKIDVQGAELEVLTGSTRVISKFSPTILLEIDNENGPNKTAKIINYFQENFKKYEFLNARSMEKISDKDILIKKGYFDILCTIKNSYLR